MITIHSPVAKRDRILSVVSNYYKVDPFENTRKREIVLPRQIAMYLLWNMGEMTLTGIGKMFGKDHSTVIAAKRTVMNLCETSPELRNQIVEIESYLE